MAATQSGKVVNFGFTGTDGIAATALTGKLLLQSADFEPAAEEQQIKDAVGALATRVFYNPSYKATLEYIPTGADVATAITNTAALTIGGLVNITACTSMPDLVKSNWIVTSFKASGSNAEAKKITLGLESHSGITAAAT
jgi:hypothetical protein